jgi:hypothetical protein
LYEVVKCDRLVAEKGNRLAVLLAPGKGVMLMIEYVTYTALFAYTLVLIGVVALFNNRKR